MPSREEVFISLAASRISNIVSLGPSLEIAHLSNLCSLSGLYFNMIIWLLHLSLGKNQSSLWDSLKPLLQLHPI